MVIWEGVTARFHLVQSGNFVVSILPQLEYIWALDTVDLLLQFREIQIETTVLSLQNSW